VSPGFRKLHPGLCTCRRYATPEHQALGPRWRVTLLFCVLHVWKLRRRELEDSCRPSAGTRYGDGVVSPGFRKLHPGLDTCRRYATPDWRSLSDEDGGLLLLGGSGAQSLETFLSPGRDLAGGSLLASLHDFQVRGSGRQVPSPGREPWVRAPKHHPSPAGRQEWVRSVRLESPHSRFGQQPLAIRNSPRASASPLFQLSTSSEWRIANEVSARRDRRSPHPLTFPLST